MVWHLSPNIRVCLLLTVITWQLFFFKWFPPLRVSQPMPLITFEVKLFHQDQGGKCLSRVCLFSQVLGVACSPQLGAEGLHHPHQGALGHSCHILSHSQSPPRRERVRWWSSTTERWRTSSHFLEKRTRSSSFIDISDFQISCNSKTSLWSPKLLP